MDYKTLIGKTIEVAKVGESPFLALVINYKENNNFKRLEYITTKGEVLWLNTTDKVNIKESKIEDEVLLWKLNEIRECVIARKKAYQTIEKERIRQQQIVDSLFIDSDLLDKDTFIRKLSNTFEDVGVTKIVIYESKRQGYDHIELDGTLADRNFCLFFKTKHQYLKNVKFEITDRCALEGVKMSSVMDRSTEVANKFGYNAKESIWFTDKKEGNIRVSNIINSLHQSSILRDENFIEFTKEFIKNTLDNIKM